MGDLSFRLEMSRETLILVHKAVPLPFNIEEQFFKPRNSHGLGKNDKEMIRKEKREVDGESSFHWKVKKKIP